MVVVSMVEATDLPHPVELLKTPSNQSHLLLDLRHVAGVNLLNGSELVALVATFP